MKVLGIGRTTAIDFYYRGIKTIEDLRKHAGILGLNKVQKIGLKYVEDFEKRIPREKVAKMFELVKQTLFYLVRSDAKHEVEVVGSYRRGRPTCGDMDILITRKDGQIEKHLLQQLVTELERRNFITDHITVPKAFDGRFSVNYMGVCQF
jgi:DNA polymerase lambda